MCCPNKNARTSPKSNSRCSNRALCRRWRAKHPTRRRAVKVPRLAPAPADVQAGAEQLRQQQQLREGIGFSHVLRTEIAVFLAEHGRLPADIGELAIDGLTPPPAVAKAEIGAGGRIVLHFAADGLKGSVSLIPDVDVAAGFVRGWDCSTSDFPFIAEVVPECRYIPR